MRAVETTLQHRDSCAGVRKARVAIQFHAFHPKSVPELWEELSSGLSEGCLTTTSDNFTKIFPRSFIQPSTSPLSWNASHPDSGHRGSGNVLVFVTDALIPGWRNQAEVLRQWLSSCRLRAADFDSAAATDELRVEWRKLSLQGSSGLEEIADSYQKKIQATARALSASDTDLSERLFFTMTEAFDSRTDPRPVPREATRLVAASFPRITELGAELRGALEARAWDRLIEGLAHEELASEQLAELVEKQLPRVTATRRDEILAAIDIYRLAGRGVSLARAPEEALARLNDYDSALRNLQSSRDGLESRLD